MKNRARKNHEFVRWIIDIGIVRDKRVKLRQLLPLKKSAANHKTVSVHGSGI
jgi:hypothetical protein